MIKKIFMVLMAVGLSSCCCKLCTESAVADSPRIVGDAPSDTGRGLVRVSENEIRHYNGKSNFRKMLVSLDNGETWKLQNVPKSYPDAGRDLKEAPAIISNPNRPGEFFRILALGGSVYNTTGGLDGRWDAVKNSDGKLLKLSGIMRNPLWVNGGRRLIIPAHRGGIRVHYSDDDGRTFKTSNTIKVPNHKKGGVHKGVRWNHGATGATVVELKDGRLFMLMRTALDYLYQSYSDDFGATWSKPTPSPFHSTISLATLGRLEDGRLILMWCNTAPLPEIASPKATGRGEDVFTNRDVQHIAISEDDGKSWIGFREIILDSRRNNANYGTYKGSNDRGLQQGEFIELGDNRLLAAIGQHSAHRKLVIIDLNWVYEKGRKSDFTKHGLKNWSCQTYIPKYVGHCAYNRQPGAKLEQGALAIRFNDNPKLTNKYGADYRRGGATWNFPIATTGEVSFKLKAEKNSTGVAVSLLDHWRNPVDVTTPQFAGYSINLSSDTSPLNDNAWHSVKLKWDADSCQVYIDNKLVKQIKNNDSIPFGISYIHFISTADSAGGAVLIKQVLAK